jgi:hypothetical protein
MNRFTRRDVWRGAAASVSVGCAARVALAQSASGQGLLKRLRAAKKVRVGIANQPPFRPSERAIYLKFISLTYKPYLI